MRWKLFYEEYAGHDIDAVITTRELVKMIRAAHINPATLEDIESDRPMQQGTGAGVIFGATGGVMEAALRYCLLSAQERESAGRCFPSGKKHRLPGEPWRSGGRVQVDDITVRTAVVSGLGNTRALLEKIDGARFTMTL